MPFAFGIDKLEPAFDESPIPYIAYGSRYQLLAAEHVENTLNASRVYLIISAGLAKSTPVALKRIQESLGEKLVGTRIGMSPHTRWNEVIEVANDAAKYNPDCIITIGGGSLTDAAKIIAWVLANDVTTTEGLSEMWTHGSNLRTDLKPSTIRTIAIPTTLSSGEYQALAGATKDDGSNLKCAFNPPPRNPSLVILDPDLVTTTPEKVWLSSGIRGVDHCIETLCSLQSTPTGNDYARKGLLKLIPALLRTKQDPSDTDARFDSLMGAKDAMAAVSSGIPLGGSHAIGHQLGPMGVGHGETSCVALPAVCKYNAAQNANRDQQAACKKLLLRTPEVRALIQDSGKTEEEVDLGDVLDLVIRKLGLPRTLKDVGVGRDKLDVLAENTLKDPWATTNAVPLTDKAQVLRILDMFVE